MSNFEDIMESVDPNYIPLNFIHSISLNYQNGARARLVCRDFSHLAAQGVKFSSKTIASLEQRHEVIASIDVIIDHVKLEKYILAEVSTLLGRFLDNN